MRNLLFGSSLFTVERCPGRHQSEDVQTSGAAARALLSSI